MILSIIISVSVEPKQAENVFLEGNRLAVASLAVSRLNNPTGLRYPNTGGLPHLRAETMSRPPCKGQNPVSEVWHSNTVHPTSSNPIIHPIFPDLEPSYPISAHLSTLLVAPSRAVRLSCSRFQVHQCQALLIPSVAGDEGDFRISWRDAARGKNTRKRKESGLATGRLLSARGVSTFPCELSWMSVSSGLSMR